MKNPKTILVVIVFVAVLVVQNTEEVVTRILFSEFRMPRAVLLFVTFALGFVVGAIVTMRFRKPAVPAAKP